MEKRLPIRGRVAHVIGTQRSYPGPITRAFHHRRKRVVGDLLSVKRVDLRLRLLHRRARRQPRHHFPIIVVPAVWGALVCGV